MMFCKYKNLTYSSKTNKIILSDYKKVHLVAQWCVYFRNLHVKRQTKCICFVQLHIIFTDKTLALSPIENLVLLITPYNFFMQP